MATIAHGGSMPAAARPRTMPVGAIGQLKMVKLFHETAWWLVNAQSTQTVEASALADDLASNLVHIFWRPTVQTVETASRPQFDNNVHSVAADLMKQFVSILHERGHAAAQVFANQVHSRQVAAQNTVLARIADARAHDDHLIQQCRTSMVFLSNTIFVCEVALAAGVCVLSFGGAPAIMGATGAMQGIAGAGISEGYSLLSNVVNNASAPHPVGPGEEAKGWFFANETKMSHATGGVGFATMAGAAKAEHGAIAQIKLMIVAQEHIRSLNEALGHEISLSRRAELLSKQGTQTLDYVKASRARAAFENTKTGFDRVGKGFAVIQLAADWYNAWSGLKERNVAINN